MGVKGLKFKFEIPLCRTKVPQSASRRHREKINATLEELGGLLPLPEEARSKLDKLTVLKLSVSFFQTQNYLKTGKYCIW